MMMRTAFHIIRANLLQLVRDRRAILIMIAMPLVITLILSFALGGMFGGKSIPSFQVSIYSADKGPLSSELVHVLKSVGPTLRVGVRTTELAAENDVTLGRSDVGVMIPQTFSKDVIQGKTGNIQVFGPMNRDAQMHIVQSIVDQYGAELSTLKLNDVKGFAGSTAPHAVVGSSAFAGVNIDVSGTGTHPLTSGNYYAIGMMVMFLLNTAVNRANALVNERNSDTYKRIQAAPASRFSLSLGYWLSYCIIFFGQGFLLLLGSRFILGITLGPWEQMILILFGYTLTLSGITMALGTYINNPQLMDSMGGIGTQILAVLGGSIVPIFTFPKVLQQVGHILPNAQALNALDNIVTGATFRSLISPSLYLITFGIILFVAAHLRFARPQTK